MSFKKIVV